MIKLKNLLTEVVCGQCFRWAYRKVLKGGPLLNLVHGTIHAPFLNKRINHAWVETKKEYLIGKTMKVKIGNMH